MKFGESRVSDIVEQIPRATLVFEILGIDYCHNDQRTLSVAAAAASCDVNEVTDLLNRTEVAPRPASPKGSASFSQMTSYVVDVYHRRARRMLIDLLELIGRIASSHSAKHPELWALKASLEDIARKLIPHMVSEERFLFPYIRSMDGKVPDTTTVIPLFGTVQYPLQSLRHDHGQDRTLIDRIREITHNFSPPEDACSRYRILYSMLADFTNELREHIEFEDDVLFPRAIDAERKFFSASA
jgi:regulator of cell morphogenesis and NO signaling